MIKLVIRSWYFESGLWWSIFLTVICVREER